MNLFQLSDGYQDLVNRDDLDPQAMSDTLEAIQDARDVKLDNIASMIEELNTEAARLKDKAKSFSEEATYRTNKAKWLKQYLTNYLDAEGIKKIDLENHILSTRNFKASTVVDSIDDLPAEYINMKMETTADKALIYQSLKAGEEVPGAHLVPNRGVIIK